MIRIVMDGDVIADASDNYGDRSDIAALLAGLVIAVPTIPIDTPGLRFAASRDVDLHFEMSRDVHEAWTRQVTNYGGGDPQAFRGLSIHVVEAL
jgi:hypothetical protein